MPATHSYSGVAAWNFKMIEEVRSYEQAAEVFERLYLAATPATMTTDALKLNGSRYGYKIGPKMYIFNAYDAERESGCYEVWLYETPIIRYYEDGTFSVDNGGFNTPTTTERLQALLPDGYRCYHHSTPYIKGKLGLSAPGSRLYPRRGKAQPEGVLWPLDHDRRIRI